MAKPSETLNEGNHQENLKGVYKATTYPNFTLPFEKMLLKFVTE